MDFPPLACFTHRPSHDAFRIGQLITQLLHLLSRLDSRHFRDVVIVQTFGVVINKVEDLFLRERSTQRATRRLME
jgi:hypothetical protein